VSLRFSRSCCSHGTSLIIPSLTRKDHLAKVLEFLFLSPSGISDSVSENSHSTPSTVVATVEITCGYAVSNDSTSKNLGGAICEESSV